MCPQEIGVKTVLKNVYLIEIDSASKVVAPASDISDLKSHVAGNLTLNPKTILLDHRGLNIGVDRENSTEEVPDTGAVVVQVGPRSRREIRRRDRCYGTIETEYTAQCGSSPAKTTVTDRRIIYGRDQLIVSINMAVTSHEHRPVLSEEESAQLAAKTWCPGDPEMARNCHIVCK